MRKLDFNNPFLLACADGEHITVRVESSNTLHSVVYSLDGGNAVLPEGQALTFLATKKPAKDQITLSLALNFSDPSGSYAVEVSGDRGGGVSKVVEQARGRSASYLAFTFLPGDPTIPPP